MCILPFWYISIWSRYKSGFRSYMWLVATISDSYIFYQWQSFWSRKNVLCLFFCFFNLQDSLSGYGEEKKVIFYVPTSYYFCVCWIDQGFFWNVLFVELSSQRHPKYFQNYPILNELFLLLLKCLKTECDNTP